MKQTQSHFTLNYPSNLNAHLTEHIAIGLISKILDLSSPQVKAQNTIASTFLTQSRLSYVHKLLFVETDWAQNSSQRKPPTTAHESSKYTEL